MTSRLPSRRGPSQTLFTGLGQSDDARIEIDVRIDDMLCSLLVAGTGSDCHHAGVRPSGIRASGVRPFHFDRVGGNGTCPVLDHVNQQLQIRSSRSPSSDGSRRRPTMCGTSSTRPGVPCGWRWTDSAPSSMRWDRRRRRARRRKRRTWRRNAENSTSSSLCPRGSRNESPSSSGRPVDRSSG